MQKRDGGLLFSPSDLTAFLDSEFASWMDHYYIERRSGDLAPAPEGQGTISPDAGDEQLELIRQKGFEHERRFLANLKAKHAVVEIQQVEDAYEQTLAAMKARAPIIYQGYLRHQQLAGYSDFLALTDSGTYEPWDTKLARSPKPYFVLQLCAYAEMIATASPDGTLPKRFKVVLGTNDEHEFQTRDFIRYYRAFKQTFLDFHAAFDAGKRPHPGDFASHGRWSTYAQARLAESRHLSAVAGITRSQIEKLEARGITTIDALAQAQGAIDVSMTPRVLARLRKQASLQLASADKAVPHFDAIAPSVDEPRRGLALLPPKSALDVFFDMEGYPLELRGLEYLFGATDHDGVFKEWWAHDDGQEKVAFEQFVDWVMERFRRDPSMHVFHYGAYEKTALSKLMGKHATREHEIDTLLRAEVLVDLLQVTKQGFVIGTPGYSLKDVERLYRPARSGDVKTAAGSMVAYQRWLDHPDGATSTTSKMLAEIRDYNRDDCDSTRELCGWLWAQQQTTGVGYLAIEQKPEKPPPDSALCRELIARVEEGRVSDPEEARVTRLLAQLLGFHERESKPEWWKYFDRRKQTDDELADDRECLTGLVRFMPPKRAFSLIGPNEPENRLMHVFKFDPEHESKLGKGSTCLLSYDEKTPVEIADMDRGGGLVVLYIPPEAVVRDELTLVPKGPPNVVNATRAVHRHVSDFAQGRVRNRAVDAFVRRQVPRIKDHPAGSPLLQPNQNVVEGLTDIVRRMDGTTISVQGPPGTGKTYTAARVIVTLLSEGKRVAVMANSHKAVFNLMREVHSVANERSKTFRMLKIRGDETDDLVRTGAVEFRHDNANIDQKQYQAVSLIGASTYAFARELQDQKFDYLFVDEAGQVAIGNVVAAGQCAKNIVLLGDQMQLAQPTKGSHPGESAKSSLDYLLQGAATVPPEMGVLLSTTYRMHPAIAQFVSDATYEGKLRADWATESQCVQLPPAPRLIKKDKGIVWVPVTHLHRAQSSDEEVRMVAAIIDDLIGRRVIPSQTSDVLPHALALADILVVTPYNVQVRKLQSALGDKARVGTVDKFQGQEAAVVIVSMCASSIEDASRGADFLLSPNRLNVAISRAQALAIVVGSPALVAPRCNSIAQMRMANMFAWMVEHASV